MTIREELLRKVLFMRLESTIRKRGLSDVASHAYACEEAHAVRAVRDKMKSHNAD